MDGFGVVNKIELRRDIVNDLKEEKENEEQENMEELKPAIRF